MFTYHTALYYALYDTSRVDIRTRSPIYEDEPRKGVDYDFGTARAMECKEKTQSCPLPTLLYSTARGGNGSRARSTVNGTHGAMSSLRPRREGPRRLYGRRQRARVGRGALRKAGLAATAAAARREGGGEPLVGLQRARVGRTRHAGHLGARVVSKW